jgi:hypothetical protein
MDAKWAALGINLLVALVAWNRRLYILNTPALPLEAYKLYALFFSFFSGVLWWISIVAIERELLLQLCAGAIATTMSWFGQIIVVNRASHPVQPRQFAALGYYLLTDACWQIQARLILN